MFVLVPNTFDRWSFTASNSSIDQNNLAVSKRTPFSRVSIAKTERKLNTE